jgi:hypothetical protein
MIVVHRLAKVANNPVLKCPIPDDVIGVCGNEDCRDRVPGLDQMPVQLDSSHSRHVDVSDQAGGLGERSRH